MTFLIFYRVDIQLLTAQPESMKILIRIAALQYLQKNYCKASNPYLEDSDAKEEASCITNTDASDLYGRTMVTNQRSPKRQCSKTGYHELGERFPCSITFIREKKLKATLSDSSTLCSFRCRNLSSSVDVTVLLSLTNGSTS